MKKHIAKYLRRTADKLDPVPTMAFYPFTQTQTFSSSAGINVTYR